MQNKILKHFSLAISYIFHPLFVNFFIAIIILYCHPLLRGKLDFAQLSKIGLLLLITLIGIPILALNTFKRAGYISSFHLPNQKERFLPFIFIAALLAISAYQIWDGSFNTVAIMILCSAIALFVNASLLTFTKASVHTMAMAGGAAYFLKEGIYWQNNQFILLACFFILFTGIVATSRLVLKAHNFKEILIGLLIGILVILCII